MNKRMVPIPAGALVVIEQGAYSDKRTLGVFRATETLDADALMGAYTAQHPAQAVEYGFDHEQFVAWLSAQGLLYPIDTWTWHTGSYGEGHSTVRKKEDEG